MKKPPLVLWLSLLLVSCTSYKEIVRYPTVDSETFANADLKQLFRENTRPSIVLRVPNTSDMATSNTQMSTENILMYNAIEKELLEEGFSVRDRGLFNEVMVKSTTQDYSKIKDLTNTDLILEVINIDQHIVYSTNKVNQVYKTGTEKEVLQDKDYKARGFSIEFKVVIVRNNEIAGTYKYQYKPCVDGCPLSSFNPTGKKSNVVELRETVTQNDAIDKFMRESTRKLVESFKNQ
jgi:hypothetical protein